MNRKVPLKVNNNNIFNHLQENNYLLQIISDLVSLKTLKVLNRVILQFLISFYTKVSLVISIKIYQGL
jgi:hypothetical protein